MSPVAKVEEVDPEWANICSTFVVSLETKGSKVRAAQHSFHAARKRKQQQEERLKAKFIKLEQQTKETPEMPVVADVPVENGIEPPTMPVIQPKLEPVEPVEPEVALEPVLIPKVLDEDEKSVLSDASSEALPVRLRKKVQLPSSSESDYEEELTLAERQQHRRRVVNSSSSTEQSESSTEESDWSDDVGKTVSGRLRTTRTKGRNYNTRKTKESKKEGVKTRRGRRRIKSSTSSEEEEVEAESDSASESPEPKRRTRRTAQRSKSSSRSPSPEVRKTRNSKISKKPGPKKVEKVETLKLVEVKANNKIAKIKATKEKKEKENKSATKKGAKIVAADKPDKNISENSQDNGFYPGWESELVKFKQSLRMPSNLIRVHSRPNSDPPTPTKKRRGVTNSPMSDCGTRGKKCDPETPIRKKVIRDVELSDSSCSMPGRPRKKNEKVSQDVLKKLATKLKSKVGALKKALKTEEAETKKETLPPRRGLRQRRRSSRLSGNSERRHLRSAAQQRSIRILINSKKHLRRRDMKVKVKQEGTTPKPVAAKKAPGRGRRKLRSSGFDYLRKRKKKKEGSETSSISKKVRIILMQPNQTYENHFIVLETNFTFV